MMIWSMKYNKYFDGIANIKVEANTSKNQEVGIIMEAKVFQCKANKIWRSKKEALIAYTHPF